MTRDMLKDKVVRDLEYIIENEGNCYGISCNVCLIEKTCSYFLNTKEYDHTLYCSILVETAKMELEKVKACKIIDDFLTE